MTTHASPLRSLLERISRRVVLRRRLPRDFGGQSIFVTPGSALSYWKPGLARSQPLLLRWVAELVKPGDVVYDIGANVGVFAFAAAARAGATGRVLAVEPDDSLTALMRRSVLRRPAGAAPVAILTAAVADEVGVADFCIAARSRSASFLAGAAPSTQTGGVRELRQTVTVTLDWLAERFAPPHLVKLDVEGGEAASLAGAARTLARTRPVLLCEVGAVNAAIIAASLQGHGYLMLDAELDPAERRPLDLPAWNTLAIPEERGRLEPTGSPGREVEPPAPPRPRLSQVTQRTEEAIRKP